MKRIQKNAFESIVIVVIIITVYVAGTTYVIAVNSLDKIPSGETGLIISKNPINSTDCIVNLSGGKTLHVVNNILLFQSLQENQTYAFSCHFNFYTKITYIDDAIKVP